MTIRLSQTSEHAREEYERFLGVFLRESPIVSRRGEPGVADLLFGDPHDPPLPAIADIIQRQVAASHEQRYRYIHHLPETRDAAAHHLSRRTGIGFHPKDIFLTTGAFAGLSICLQALAERDSEVIYFSPPWFYYRSMIKAAGAIPRGIDLDPDNWSIPLDELAAALGPQTSAILLNSPHNPTGKVFSDEELIALSGLVAAASRRIGRTIPIISDEAYARIVYDEAHAPSIAKYYPATVVIYTYGKTLLAPSLRLGYMALTPDFPDGLSMHKSFDAIQPIGGWLLPTCIMQRALPELEELCIDLGRLRRRREKIIAALEQGGYKVLSPQGTFYTLVGSRIANDVLFAEQLAAKGVLVLPGSTLETPGTFRISLTASDSMIEQACTVFRSAVPATAQV